MKRSVLLSWLAASIGAGLTTQALRAAETDSSTPPLPAALQLPELLDVLRSNLAGATPEELNRAAVAGLLEQLAPRVTLVDDTSPAKDKAPGRNGPALSTAVFDRAYGYIRLSGLGPETGRDFESACDGLASSNKLRGLILDLRFSASGNYTTAVSVADRFFGTVQELVDWGEGMNRSTAKSNYLTLPTTVLVNRKTSGAAEVLAGILRHGEAALLVGTNTAGQAGVTKEFTLKTGHRLRVAVAPVKVLKNEELPFTGIKPDIEVGVDADEERLFMSDAFRNVKQAGAAGPVDTALVSTNNRSRRRMNEADLVRMTREGQDPREISGTPPPARAPDTAVPQVTDPVLARALDILKGLAVVQRFRGL